MAEVRGAVVSGRDRFLQPNMFYSSGQPITSARKFDIYDEVESIADQISMLSDLTYREAYKLVFNAVMDVYESHKK